MDKRSSEQKFHKSITVTFLCEKIGVVALAQPCPMAGRLAGSLADEMLQHLEIFKPGARDLWPRAPGFLKLFWFMRRYVCVCVCMCVSVCLCVHPRGQ